MLNFQNLTLGDLPRVKPYLLASSSRACDNTVGGVFMWRDFFQTQYAFADGTLFFRVCYAGGVNAYPFPLGGDSRAALQTLRGHCLERGEQLIFCTVTEPDLKRLLAEFNCFASPERDFFDYLYAAEDLVSLAGRKYSGQRNHIHAFQRAHPDYVFEPIGPENLADVRRFYDRFQRLERKDAASFKEDQRKVLEIFDNFDVYGLFGGALRAQGEVLAFALGEIVGDTLFVHVEKADFTVRGAYQMVVNEFAKRYVGPGISYINREDDAGDLGLRTSKLSYHPIRLIEKYTVLTGEEDS